MAASVTTTPPQQPPPRKPAPPQPPAPKVPALAAQVITALASAYTTASLTAALAGPFAAIGVSVLALRLAAGVVMSWPADVLEGTGPAARHMVRANLVRRAQFLIAAAGRIQQAVTAARSAGEAVTVAAETAARAELRYLALHVQASQKRIAAASAVDGAAAEYGPLLGWSSVLDDRTTAECRAAAGKNFAADHPPRIGLPGAVHPACRCWPSAPHPGAAVLR
jgi:hypothetical protein